MKNNELEERLLNNASIDELIKMKIEKNQKKKSRQKSIQILKMYLQIKFFQNFQCTDISTAKQNAKLL